MRREGTPGRYAYVLSKGSMGCVTGSYGLYTGAAVASLLFVLFFIRETKGKELVSQITLAEQPAE